VLFRSLGINGFGRIGKLVLRAAFKSKKAKIMAINNPMMDTDYLIYHLKYDTVHGRFEPHIEKTEGGILVDGHKIHVYNKSDPKDIPWGDCDANFICDSAGKFLDKEKANSHLISGAKKVIISAPTKDDTPTYVFGVNHHNYKPEQNIVSNASCTTNCIAPLAKIIND